MDEKKQIEEMANDMCGNFMANGNCATDDEPCTLECVYGCCVEKLYCKGYRKQSVGEWYLEKETYGRMLCSNCREEALVKHEYNDERKGHLVYVKSSFCPNCGARMKGDEGK